MSFKSDNWIIGAERRLLVTIALTDPSSKRDTGYPSAPTLAFCDVPEGSRGVFTYGGVTYSPTILGFQGNASSVDFRGSTSDADAVLTLANVRYAFQNKHAVGAPETNQYNVKLSQLMADYVWQGAVVTAYLYCKVGAAESTQEVFKGGIVLNAEASVKTVTVRIIQDKKAIRPKPDVEGPGSATYPSVVQKINYASAPDGSIGQSIPIIYGSTLFTPDMEDVDGLCVKSTNVLNLFVPVGIESRYDGTYVSKFALSSYPTQTAPGTSSIKTYVYFSEGDRLAVADDADVVVTSNVQELLASIATSSRFKMYINPTDWVAGTTGVTDAGKAFDGISGTYAVVAADADGTDRALDLLIPQVGPYGRITGFSAFILLAPGGSTIAGVDGSVYGTFGIYNNSTAAYHDAVNTNITKANVRDGGFLTADCTATTYDRTAWHGWQWTGTDAGGNAQQCYFRVKCDTALTTIRVIACGFRVEFEPAIPAQKSFADTPISPYIRSMK